MKDQIYRILIALGYTIIANDLHKENDPKSLKSIRNFAMIMAERKNRHDLLKDEANG